MPAMADDVDDGWPGKVYVVDVGNWNLRHRLAPDPKHPDSRLQAGTATNHDGRTLSPSITIRYLQPGSASE